MLYLLQEPAVRPSQHVGATQNGALLSLLIATIAPYKHHTSNTETENAKKGLHLVRLRCSENVSDRLGSANGEGPNHRAVHDVHHGGLDAVRVEPYERVESVADMRLWADNVRRRLLMTGSGRRTRAQGGL